MKQDGYKPWLDEKDLLPGQDWQLEIRNTIRNSDVVLVCLSKTSINKRDFVQKEIKIALDIADEQPEGAVFIIPVRLEECSIPDRLTRWHWVNVFTDDGYKQLLRSLL